MRIVTRKAAAAGNLKFYYTGKPCHRGHVSKRRVSTRQCMECERLYSASWYSRNAEQSSAYHKARRKTHPDIVRQRDRAAYKRNRDARRGYQATYRAKNKDKIRQYDQMWRSKNQDKRTAIQRNRKARTAAGGTHTAADIKEIKFLQRGRCGYCREKLGDDYHVDHIVAVSKGGTNTRRNLQILCPSCNMQKHAQDAVDFARKIGRLI